jgi:hypothetical protein
MMMMMVFQDEEIELTDDRMNDAVMKEGRVREEVRKALNRSSR